MIRETASAAIRKAEIEIAQLATDAAGQRDYDTAEVLLGIARNLAGTAESLASPRPRAGGNGVAGVAQAVDHATESVDEDEPIFQRDGEELVKTARSRGDGNTYEHKAPRASVEALLDAVSHKANRKGEFSTGRVFPLADAEGRKLPVYQGYLALRWLRQIGLVHRVARQRYQMVPGKDPVSSVEAAWQALPRRDS